MLVKQLQKKLTLMALCWIGLGWAGLVFAGQAQANCMASEAVTAEAALSPYQLIGSITDEVLAEIDRHRAERDDSADEIV